MSFIEIDGSYLEGGGQILRNALSLSCILRRSIRVRNIRANRPNPGLSNQHLSAVNFLAEITGALVVGNELKSTEVEFNPKLIKYGNYKVNAQTAASITLVIQAALPVLIFGERSSEVEIMGGTNVGMAPQVDYMTEVFRPNLELFGATFDFDLIRRGYYPRGGGCCKVSVPPVRCIKAATITKFGRLTEISGWCFVAGRLPIHLAQEMKSHAEKELKSSLNVNEMNIEMYKESPEMARDNGSGVVLKAVTSEGCVLGGSSLGDKKVDAPELGKKAAKELIESINREICVDSHVQDQLILFMALASGVSTIRTCALTNHTRSAIYVAELIAGVTFHIKEDGDNVLVSCEGCGYQNK